MPLFEVDNTSWNDDFRIADDLVLRSIILLMRNVLEFLSLIGSEHLVLDRMSHALLAACASFGMNLLLILIFLDLLLLLQLFGNDGLEILHVGVILLGDLSLFGVSNFGNLLVHIDLLFKLVELLQKVVQLAVNTFGFLHDHPPIVISLVNLQFLRPANLFVFCFL